jgi:hypothetical protein
MIVLRIDTIYQEEPTLIARCEGQIVLEWVKERRL